jgi:hypothetical protein
MEIGTDSDGRAVEYDPDAGQFTVGGIRTTVDHLVAYDRSGHVKWATDDLRDWAHECARQRSEQVAPCDAPAGSAETAPPAAPPSSSPSSAPIRRVPGYNRDSIIKFAAVMKGVGTTFMVASVVLGLLGGGALALTLAGVMSLAAGVTGGSATPLCLVTVAVPAFGAGVGFAIGYLARMGMLTLASMMLALVQVEVNTQPLD